MSGPLSLRERVRVRAWVREKVTCLQHVPRVDSLVQNVATEESLL
jgi:hypothetical protein